LLGLLPVVNWFFWIIIGIKGNKWAWQNLKWESVESFQAKQKAWNIFGFLMFFIPILFFAVGAGVYLSYLENKPASPYYQSSISVNN
jgi:hypothetical protein